MGWKPMTSQLLAAHRIGRSLALPITLGCGLDFLAGVLGLEEVALLVAGH